MYGLITDLLAVLDIHIENLQKKQNPEEIKELQEKTKEKVKEKANQRQQAEESSDSRLAQLIRVCGLDEFEIFVLTMIMAPRLNPEYGGLYARLQGSGERQPTRGLALMLYLGAHELEERKQQRFLCDEGPLGKYCLSGSKGEVLYLDRNIDDFLLHPKTTFTPRMEGAVFQTLEEPMPPLLIHRSEAAAIRELWQNCREAPLLIQLSGETGSGRHFLMKKILAESRESSGILLFNLTAFLQQSNQHPEQTAAKLKGYAWLSGQALCLELPEIPEDRESVLLLRNFLRELLQEDKIHPLGIFLMTETDAEAVLQDCKRVYKFTFSALTASDKTALWDYFAKEMTMETEGGWEEEAGKYILTASGIQNVLQTALLHAHARGRGWVSRVDIHSAHKMRQPKQLGSYASVIETVFTWEDLILEEKQKKVLHLICNQLKYRRKVGEEWGFYRKMPYGRGISALFYGAPGTGKTMAVQVMAQELGLSLYRIDLSQMVSKYIGETEKNISDLFERAGSINAILFFDEADALFARRSEIRDANDRSANSMTAHLLQKLEDYQGIAVLATNLLHNMDDAFKRRIKYTVQFQFPGPAVRLQLFQSILPAEAVCGEKLDFAFFAEHFELSGSSIKEVLLNAAFMAAGEDTGICNCHVVEAIKWNYLKYGKVLTGKDFGYLG